MNLTDEGIAIGIKKFSDSTNLMKILTRDNGIYSGLIRLKKKPRKCWNKYTRKYIIR